MPEGPELASSRDKLNKLLIQSRLTEISVGVSGRYVNKHPVGMVDFISKMESAGTPIVEKIHTHGKFMWWEFQFPDREIRYMYCTYGMAGSWRLEPDKHTSFVVGVSRDEKLRKLFFNDPRHFGTIKFVASSQEHKKKLASLGPCVLGSGLTPEIFAKNILRKPNRTICEALMDQSAVAGIGNYLRAEVMFDCGIDPWKGVTELVSEQYMSLCNSSVMLAKSSYESQGASIKTYRTLDGSLGATQFTFKIYGEKFCPSGHVVERKQDSSGRTVHWCPTCQK